MNFIVWIIFGALAGWIASMIMKTNQQQGAIANILVGIVGAFLGGFIVQLFGAKGVTGFNLTIKPIESSWLSLCGRRYSSLPSRPSN